MVMTDNFVLDVLLAILAIWQYGILPVLSLSILEDAWKLSDHIIKDGATFDYIVVGAGAGGSAAAARLALAGNHVLLIEAGGDPGLFSEIPQVALALQGSHIDWFYETTSNEKSCLSFHNKQCRFSRGRCLGGSTSINYMLYIRGNRNDYDLGIPGWSWRDLEPYFLRSEGLQSVNHVPLSSHQYHNTSGPVKISSFNNSGNPWSNRIMEALMSLNFPHNADVNGESQIGVSKVLGYVYRGKRVSAATAYLDGRDVRNNLLIAPKLICTGVIIDENNEARGVTAVREKFKKITLNFYARNEVILSAGTVGSAQLLMLSGVGPADHLTSLGIPVRADLPVGNDMSDHILPLILIRVDQMLKDTVALIGMMGVNALKWLATHDGPFASIGVTDMVGFANTNCYNFLTRKLENKYDECDLPNVQIIFSYINMYAMNLAPHLVEQIFGRAVMNQILAANRKSSFIVVSPILLQPRSRGWVRLNSADPLASPAITPNYLDDEMDVKEMLRSVKIVKHLVETDVFNKYNASILRLKFENCPEFEQIGYWECYIRHMTNSVYHAVGTVALGKVLDERLRVRNVKRLRVGDLSVLPRIPRGNTAAATFAIGERLADFLLEDKNKLD